MNVHKIYTTSYEYQELYTIIQMSQVSGRIVLCYLILPILSLMFIIIVSICEVHFVTDCIICSLRQVWLAVI
jgi:hypothetical protein